MTLLIDSDVAMSVLNGRSDAIRVMDELRHSELSMSAVSVAELVEGIINGPLAVTAQLGFQQFMRGIRMRVVNRAIGERTGQIRAGLRKRHLRVDDRAIDLIIAATAIEHGLTLVTRNLKDYRDIPGIQIYPWDGAIL